MDFSRTARSHLDRSFKHCAQYWSCLVLEGEVQWMQGRGEPADEFMKKVLFAIASSQSSAPASSSSLAALAPCQPAAGARGATTAATDAGASSPSGTDFFSKLQALMDWRSKGWLSLITSPIQRSLQL